MIRKHKIFMHKWGISWGESSQKPNAVWRHSHRRNQLGVWSVWNCTQIFALQTWSKRGFGRTWCHGLRTTVAPFQIVCKLTLCNIKDIRGFPIFTARKRSLRRLCFYRCLSFILFTGGGAWFYLGGAWFYLAGHAWFYLGGMRGFIRGACIVLFGGHAWFYSGGVHGFIQGVCMVLFGGVCGFIRGHAWFYLGGMHGFIWGACMVLFGGACVVSSVFSDTMRYGQWAGGTHSYWNAFLLFTFSYIRWIRKIIQW